MDFLPADCMDIVIEKRITDMEEEISNLKNKIIKKLEDEYEKEKRKTPEKFSFKALRAAINIRVFINDVDKTSDSEDEDDGEDEDEGEEQEEEE
tara:strand:- start:273 stop:554 length:282 start_codon:yes stop_codon:yes gene_type:complete